MSKSIGVCDTILRDAHQSLVATRMGIHHMLPALPHLNRAGYWSLEAWGGATFDVCLRYLDEDPWERLRLLKDGLPDTKVQMLLRGKNLVGYRPYCDSVVKAFIQRAQANGVEIFRIFDALNDLDNMRLSIQTALSTGAMVEGCVAYTTSPVHENSIFVQIARELKQLGCHIICIKDMAGMLSPQKGASLAADIMEATGLPLHLHSHCASGMSPVVFLEAAKSGVGLFDCALSPFSWGSSHPPTETMHQLFAEAGYDTGLDMEQVFQATGHFRTVAQDLWHLRNPRAVSVDSDVLQHQIPGGMYSNLISMLEAQKASRRLDEVLAEVPAVRKDLGYPPLVTPTSQMVGAQAVTNVLVGKRYAFILNELKDYLRGAYGKPPAAPSQELLDILDKRSPGWRELKSTVSDSDYEQLAASGEFESQEDLLSVAIFGDMAREAIKKRQAKDR